MVLASHDHLSRRQHGLVTGTQLGRLGWRPEQIRHAVRAGRLERVRRGVFRAAGAPRTKEQALLAAVLASEGCVLSHRTAAAAWPLRFVPDPAGIDLLRVGSRPQLEGVCGHETDLLPPEHVTKRDRLPLTTPSRTIIDCCGLLTPRQLRSCINDALRRRLTTLPVLTRTVDEVPRSGRRAIVPVSEDLRSRVPGYDPGDSDPEIDLVELLVGAGYPRPEQQVRVVAEGRTAFVDVGWRERRVGFEYDSLEFHEHRFHEDRDRLRRLKRAGWDIWPVTSTTSKNEILAIAAATFRHQLAA
jgi:hypothetical protein